MKELHKGEISLSVFGNVEISGGEYPDITVNIHFYFCKITDEKPVCKEHHKIQWSTRDEISKRTLCPADQKMWEAQYKTIDEFVQYNFAKQKYDEVVSENIHNF